MILGILAITGEDMGPVMIPARKHTEGQLPSPSPSLRPSRTSS